MEAAGIIAVEKRPRIDVGNIATRREVNLFAVPARQIDIDCSKPAGYPAIGKDWDADHWPPSRDVDSYPPPIDPPPSPDGAAEHPRQHMREQIRAHSDSWLGHQLFSKGIELRLVVPVWAAGALNPFRFLVPPIFRYRYPETWRRCRMLTFVQNSRSPRRSRRSEMGWPTPSWQPSLRSKS